MHLLGKHVMLPYVTDLKHGCDVCGKQKRRPQGTHAHHLTDILHGSQAHVLSAHHPAEQSSRTALAWDLPRFLPAAGASSSLLSSWI